MRIESRVNIIKRIKIGGRYYVEGYVGGTRRRVSAGVTAAQALEAQRRKHHELEGHKLVSNN